MASDDRQGKQHRPTQCRIAQLNLRQTVLAGMTRTRCQCASLQSVYGADRYSQANAQWAIFQAAAWKREASQLAAATELRITRSQALPTLMSTSRSILSPPSNSVANIRQALRTRGSQVARTRSAIFGTWRHLRQLSFSTPKGLDCCAQYYARSLRGAASQSRDACRSDAISEDGRAGSPGQTGPERPFVEAGKVS